MFSQNRHKFNDIFIITFLMVLALFITLMLAYTNIKKNSEEACYNALKIATEQMGYEIRTNIKEDSEQLKIIANIISQYDNIDGVQSKKVISGFESRGTITHLEMLLPDNTVITSSGDIVSADEVINFADEKDKGEYISEISVDISHGDTKAIRICVPVIKNGNAAAMLYGVIDLKKFPQKYKSEIYMGQSSVYLVEGKSGNFIIDTWHKELGNINSLADRKYKKGFENVDIIADMRSGNSDFVVFSSNTTKEYLYGYYTPTGINDWMVMLTVPESTVLASAHKSQYTLSVMSAVMLLVIALYFVWLLIRGKRQKRHIEYMLLIEKTLFSAHRNHENIIAALKIVAENLRADTVFFTEFNGNAIQHIDIWTKTPNLNFKKYEGQRVLKAFPGLIGIFKDNISKISYGKNLLTLDKSSVNIDYVINSYILTGVRNADNVLIGVLGALNLKKEWKNALMLESVSHTFSIALGNLHTYQTIRELGVIDALTGLLNRNSFEKSLELYEQNSYKNLTCAYIDANGLHDLNNAQGHDMGDNMLKTIADALLSEIGVGNVYRIGGDEFIAFIENKSAEQAFNMVQRARNIIEKSGYSISVGIEFENEAHDINAMIKRAEGQMLEDKFRHYKNKQENLSESGGVVEWNSSTVLSVIEPHIKVGYIVNLTTDRMVNIYLSSGFRYNFEPTNNSFSDDMRIYIKNKIDINYHEQFTELLSFDRLCAQLESTHSVGMEYKLKKGNMLTLKIYKSPNYRSDSKETLWIFKE
ncbi:MAG: GGDEF domain-containing protein [Clostridia bacterium]